MRRSYVPIYHNKKDNYHVYFDYMLNEFFTTRRKGNSSIIFLSSFVAIVFYSFFNELTLNIGSSPLSLIWLSLLLGIVIGFASTIIMKKSNDKNMSEIKIVLTPTHEQLNEYIIVGKKQFSTMYFVIVFLIFLCFFTSVFLLLIPYNLVLFLVNIIFSAVLIVAIWSFRPIKRRQIVHQLIAKNHIDT